MPHERNSAEKRKEKSAARAREHRERRGIPEWDDTSKETHPIEAPESDGMQTSELIGSADENQDCDALLAEIDELLGGQNSSPAGEVTVHMATEDGEAGSFTATDKPSTPNADAVSDRREEEEPATTSPLEEEEEDYILDVTARDEDIYFND